MKHGTLMMMRIVVYTITLILMPKVSQEYSTYITCIHTYVITLTIVCYVSVPTFKASG